MWVDEKAGVIGMERIEGWSVREVLGGGAEGESEEEGEQEYDPAEMVDGLSLAEQGQSEEQLVRESEGMQALRGIGVTQGTLHIGSRV